MSGLRRFLLRLYTFLFPARAERELQREIEAHLGLIEEDFKQGGMSPDEARRAARRAFGGVEQNRELARDERSFLWLEDLRRDTRHAFRLLARNPGFSLVVILTLGIGIGGATAGFSVVHRVLLEPLPFQESDRLVTVLHVMPGMTSAEMPLSQAMYLTFREHSKTLEEIGLWKGATVTITGLGEPERVNVVQVTDRLFPLLGVSAHLGRLYTLSEVSPGSEYPILLSWDYWVQHFAADPSAIGQSLRVNGTLHEIIGILPQGSDVIFGDPAPGLYLPLIVDPSRLQVGNWSFPSVARLRPGVTLEEANDDLTGLTELATEFYPGIPLSELEARHFGTLVHPLREDLVGKVSRVLWLVFAAACLVLLVASANVAGLHLVRAEARKRDLAVRKSIGASPGRIARQMLAESSLLGLLGGGVGLLLSWGGLPLLLRLSPQDLPRLKSVALDPMVLLFALSLSLAVGLSFGLIPALLTGRRNFSETLGEGRVTSVGTRSSSGLQIRTLLVVGQVAAALVLLIAAGLMVRSFQALMSVPPGFQQPEEVLTFRLSIPSTSAQSGAEVARRHEQILRRIKALPSVASASAATSVVMDRWDSWNDVQVEDFPELDTQPRPLRRFNWIAPDYFRTLRNDLLAGREFEWADLYLRRPVAIITENLARELWQEPRRAIGRRIRSDKETLWLEIVGVVGNVHTSGVAEDPPAVLYMPLLLGEFWGGKDFTWRQLRYAVRTRGTGAISILPDVRRAVWSVDRALPLFQVATLEEILARSVSRWSFALVMLGVAAGVALLLGIVGVYGVISYGMARRAHEVGIRMVLGARPSDIGWMVLRQGVMVAATGVVIGLVAASSLAHLVSTLLFDVQPVDPLTYGFVSALLALVVVLASYLPARRASRLDPVKAVKET